MCRSFNLWLEWYCFGIMPMFRYMMPVMDWSWRTKEKYRNKTLSMPNIILNQFAMWNETVKTYHSSKLLKFDTTQHRQYLIHLLYLLPQTSSEHWHDIGIVSFLLKTETMIGLDILNLGVEWYWVLMIYQNNTFQLFPSTRYDISNHDYNIKDN